MLAGLRLEEKGESPLAQGKNAAQRVAHDFYRNPMLVYWEITQACALSCKHCRAEAMPFSQPLQLTHDESKEFLRQILEFGVPMPHLMLTGGDPLSRTDLYELIDYARALGLEVSITPSTTPTLTDGALNKLKMHGIQSLGLSLDGSNSERHDAIRSVPGCFERTIAAIQHAGRLGLPIQVNTLVAEQTVDDLPAVYQLLATLPVMRWSLFFLISVGRGKALQEVSPKRGEELMNWIFALALEAPFEIKTTEAPSYRRIALNHMRASKTSSVEVKSSSVYRGFQIRDGHGLVFVSSTGEVFPSGFLPLTSGNVRAHSLVQIYRDSPLFRALHSPNRFQGKCGMCEFRDICGGSRARAFAHAGNPLESDPLCSYTPRSFADHAAVTRSYVR
jgi:radical SAM protein